METIEKQKISFIQYLNTVILTVIGLCAFMIFMTINKVKDNQSEFSNRMVKLQTVQETNVATINKHDVRINALEMDYVNTLKQWIEDNYIRKPQR